jgi:RNA polymerase sigma factor (sigma-70 family)
MESTTPDPPEIPLNEQEFQSLMEQAQQGKEAAIAKICRYYEPIVRVTARFRLGPALRPHFDSVDLVQSVHRSLIVGLRAGKFDISSPNKLIALANAMVQRKIGRKWRKASRQHRLSGNNFDSSSVEFGLQSLIALDNEHSVEIRDQIAELCKHLSAEERTMLELRLAGLNSIEVAEQMGLHPVAIRVRWTRLRKRLESIGITPEWFE